MKKQDLIERYNQLKIEMDEIFYTLQKPDFNIGEFKEMLHSLNYETIDDSMVCLSDINEIPIVNYDKITNTVSLSYKYFWKIEEEKTNSDQSEIRELIRPILADFFNVKSILFCM